MRRSVCAALIAGLCLVAGCRDRSTPPPAPQVPAAEAASPPFTDANGRPNSDARAALALLEGAGAEGLEPDDYAASSLAQLAAVLDAARPPAANDLAAFDAALSASLIKYFRQLHAGRVDPRSLGFRISTPVDEHDFAAIVRSAVANHRIAEAAAEWEPPLVLYRGLRRALARYRALAADRAPDSLPPVTAKSVHPDEPYDGVRALYQRLVAFGDLPAGVPEPEVSSAYGGALVDGVKAFQRRHGLLADGVLGTRTQEELGVPIAHRVQQLEIALERLRWLPDFGHARLIAVNIPMFHLWAWDQVVPTGMPSFDMGVIVGRALSTKTPVFVEEMRYVIFRPYWNVPPSIATHEILPALARDPDYLRKQDMEIVAGQSDDARPVETTPESIANLRSGGLRVRQRPGPANSLGLVKFVFPNDEGVYMHGTPAQSLFSRPRRDLSHGCVRVEDPVKLAEWALSDQPAWTRSRIVAAMQAQKPSRVDLSRPIQVVLFYVTAAVMPEDGSVRFSQDIYGHDATLVRALGEGNKP